MEDEKAENGMMRIENTKGHFQNNADTDDMNKVGQVLEHRGHG